MTSVKKVTREYLWESRIEEGHTVCENLANSKQHKCSMGTIT